MRSFVCVLFYIFLRYVVGGDKISLKERYIVHFHESVAATNFATSVRSRHPQAQIHHHYSIIPAASISGVTQEEIQYLPNVRRVVKDTIKRIVPSPQNNTTTRSILSPATVVLSSNIPSWGIDRIDQHELPLDDSFTSSYTGAGVDVYIADTGLDTKHHVFANPNREVKNIYDSFASNKHRPSSNNDGQGHGTHVAGTIGGFGVGIATEANIYALKILSDAGEGSTSDIVAALDVVLSKYHSSGRPSILSMSLGGDCDTEKCEEDTLVMAVQTLTSKGVIVSVAAGNSGCGACEGSPNAAPDAIVVGATSKSDDIAYFSNYGQCVDIFAPGVNIVSSCSSKICQREDRFLQMSGTSMACPHVSGVLALMLQQDATLTPSLAAHQLRCNAAKEVLHMPYIDTVSPNLLLQIPTQSDVTCNLGSGCSNDCSNNGYCSEGRCHCTAKYYGQTCAATSDPNCNVNHARVTMHMQDSYGDGWTFASYAISDSNGRVVGNAIDSLCSGTYAQHQYCLPDGRYILEVTRGQHPEEIVFDICGFMAGAPYRGYLHIHNTICTPDCPTGALTSMILTDQYGDGWSGAYYEIYDINGVLYNGGTLMDGETAEHKLCLPAGCYVGMMASVGQFNSEVGYSICGIEATFDDIVSICVDKDGTCVGRRLEPVSSRCDAEETNVPYYLLAFNGDGWRHGTQMVISNDRNEVVHDSSLLSGFIMNSSVCLADGCYNFSVTSDSVHNDMMWYMCGIKGYAPWTAQICIESMYGLCYGLTGCPIAKTYARRSDLIQLFGSSATGRVAVWEAAHLVSELCDLEDGEFDIFIGAGRRYDFDVDMELCGAIVPIPGRARVKIDNNMTDCVASQIESVFCDDLSLKSHSLVKLDTYGDGWGRHAGYTISSINGHIIATGTLHSGQYEVDDLCLSAGTYTFSLSATQFADEIIWVLCGFAGNGPVSEMEFIVIENGCFFSAVDDDEYRIDDDDMRFVTATSSPSASPSRAPTLSPTFHPTLPPTYIPTVSPSTTIPTIVPTALPTRLPTVAPTFTPTIMTVPPTAHPTASPSTTPTPDAPLLLPLRYNISYKISSTIANAALMPIDVSFIHFALRKILFDEGLSIWSTSEDMRYTHVDTEAITNGYFEMANAGVRVEGRVSTKLHYIKLNMIHTFNVVTSSSVMIDLFALKETGDVALLLALDNGRLQSLLDQALRLQYRDPRGSRVVNTIAARTLSQHQVLSTVYAEGDAETIPSTFMPLFEDSSSSDATGTGYTTTEIIAVAACGVFVSFVLLYGVSTIKKRRGFGSDRYAHINSSNHSQHTMDNSRGDVKNVLHRANSVDIDVAVVEDSEAEEDTPTSPTGKLKHTKLKQCDDDDEVVVVFNKAGSNVEDSDL